MKQRLLAAMVLVLLLHPTAHGFSANQYDAHKAASNWVAHAASGFGTKWNGADNPRVTGVEYLCDQSDTLAYIYLVKPSGYVVVARYREIAPIVAYSTTDNLDLNAQPGWSEILRSDLLARNRHTKTLLRAEATARISGRDSRLIDKNRTSWSVWASDFDQDAALPVDETFEEFDEGETLLRSSWHQAEPYNSLCPTGDNETQCVAGCVAIAAAQVMKYWQWPPYGTGGHGYYWSGDGAASGQLLIADFSDPYDWDNILLDYSDGYTAAEDLAVAELCYEAGVAFSMNYGSSGSTASTADCLTVLPQYFGYKNTIVEEQRQLHTAGSWFTTMQQEIDAGRPLIYRFYEEGFGGHAMVCDGWRISGDFNQLHFNYGWGGSNNTWFTVDELYPLTSDYVTTQRAYRGIEPESFPTYPIPRIIATTPAKNRLNVSVATGITATFDSDMDPSTISSSSFVVNGRISGLHPGVVSYDPSLRQASFEVYRDFAPGEEVMVSISDETRSWEGAPLFGGCVWTFTTAVTPSQGTFEQASHYSTIGVPVSVCAADFNGDGDVDLATACADSASLTILLNDGKGGFIEGPECHVGAPSNAVAAADLDRDGDMDLATTNTLDRGISVMLNNGDASFADPVFYRLSDFTYPASIVTADFNGDGWLDLATGNGGDCGLSVFRNAGDGTFWQRSDHDRRGGPESFGSICTGDFDGDGYLDLAKAGSIVGTPDIHLQGGDGYFQTPIMLEWNDIPQFVSVGDLNGDGHLDLATSDSARMHQFSTALNNGDLTFSPPTIYPVDSKPWSTSAADVDGDGDLDLLTSHYQLGTITVSLNAGNGTFVSQARYSADSWPAALITADIDNDGDQDLITASRLSNTISVLRNGTSTAAVTTETEVPVLPNDFALYQNYPNPFNPITEIAFALPRAVHVRLDLFNVLGQRIATLVDEPRPAGYHSVIWNGDGSTSGVYFFRIEADGFSESKKMLLVK